MVTIGSFDGVHRGHQEVLAQLRNMAQLAKGESVVFTFDPHPVTVLAPDKPFDMLNTTAEKITLLEKFGVDHLIVYPFSKSFAALSYDEFVQQILLDKLDMKGMLIGHDNTVGKNKEGNYAQLKALSERFGFSLYMHTELKLEGAKLSSTQIRKLLSEGRLFDAAQLLGHPYHVTGTVVHGQHLGNKLGFPTANIQPDALKFLPANGVYAVKVPFKDTVYLGMMNIGTRPTVDEQAVKAVVEVHLFDFNGNLYGQDVRVALLRKIRDENKFETIDALRQQLKQDKIDALEILRKEFSDTEE